MWENVRDTILHFIKETHVAFTGGFVGSAVVCGVFIFGDLITFAGEYVIKLLGVGVAGVVGGLATAAGKHFWEQIKKKRYAKRRKKQDRQKAA